MTDRARISARNDKHRQHNTTELRRIAKEMEIRITEITPNQLRFTLEEHGTWDYYPVSNKINKVGTGKYEQLKTGIADWILDRMTKF